MGVHRKLLGLITAAALSVGGTVLLAPTASATISVPTVTTLKITKKTGEYGSLLSAYLSAETHNKSEVNGSTTTWQGTGYLQMRPAGASTWKTIGKDEGSPSYHYFPDAKFVGNADYRVYYKGVAYADYPEDVVYQDSYSPVVHVKTTRHLALKDVTKRSPARGQFTATPKFGGHLFKFQAKVGKKWKAYKTVRANKRGTAVVAFPGKAGKAYYRVTVAGDRQFTASTYQFSVYRY